MTADSAAGTAASPQALGGVGVVGLDRAVAWLLDARPGLSADLVASAAARAAAAARHVGLRDARALIGYGRASISVRGVLEGRRVRVKAPLVGGDVARELLGGQLWQASGLVAPIVPAACAADVMLVDWIEGCTVAEALLARPADTTDLLRQVGALLAALGHVAPLPGLAPAPALVELWHAWSEGGPGRAGLPGVADAARRAADQLLQLLDAATEARTAGHGDPSPANVVVAAQSDMVAAVIDASPAWAPPALILARAAVLAAPADPEAAADALADGALLEPCSVRRFLPALAVFAVDHHRTSALRRLARPFFS